VLLLGSFGEIEQFHRLVQWVVSKPELVAQASPHRPTGRRLHF